MTLREQLASLSPVPLPAAFLEAMGEELDTDMDMDVSEVSAVTLNRAKARVYLYLYTAPNISEGGVSISFTAADKTFFLRLARRYAQLAGETGLVPTATYGYKGQSL